MWPRATATIVFYRIKVGKEPCCGYFLMTNQARPCPPGDGCLVKVRRFVNRRGSSGKNQKKEDAL